MGFTGVTPNDIGAMTWDQFYIMVADSKTLKYGGPVETLTMQEAIGRGLATFEGGDSYVVRMQKKRATEEAAASAKAKKRDKRKRRRNKRTRG